ncbi:MAG: hypothetical protein R3E68_00575 [Burkholderiaceae bacterium]
MLIKTGRYVCVGLHGGTFKMPLPWLPQKALTVCGCHVGSSQMLRELIDLVRTGKIKEIPVIAAAVGGQPDAGRPGTRPDHRPRRAQRRLSPDRQ